MKGSDSHSDRDRAMADEAAIWVIRQERGLTAEEQDALSQWLGEDPRHRAALADQRWSWEELDRLAGLQTSIGAVPDRALLAPRRRARRRWFRWAALPLAMAAAVAMMILWRRPLPSSPARTDTVELLALCEQRQLDDGSVIELNRGASVIVEFSAAERRVRLERGEAHFDIATDPARPFVVEAAGVRVQAVGTEFSVSVEPERVAVLVTEGKVRVDSQERPAPGGADESPLVVAGQRVLVPRRGQEPVPEIVPVTPEQIEEHLAWKPRLLDFNESTFAEITAEFNRHNPVRLTLGDPSLASRRISGSFRSDNVQAFVHLLESDFGVKATRTRSNEIVLWKAP